MEQTRRLSQEGKEILACLFIFLSDHKNLCSK